MTEKYAALLVYVMWAWLEAHPYKYKSMKYNYPLYKELKFYKSLSECPWCRLFWLPDLKLRCKGCPISKVSRNCFSPSSFFGRWVNSPDAFDKSVNAGEIAKIAWQEYKRLGG